MKQLFILLITVFIAIASLAQNKDSSSNQDNTFQQMLDYSRPGKHHKILEKLEGSWTYKGRHPDANGNVGNYYYRIVNDTTTFYKKID